MHVCVFAIPTIKNDPRHGLLIAISVRLMTLGLTTLLPGGAVKPEEREIHQKLIKGRCLGTVGML